MKGIYYAHKAECVTYNTEPTLTDQASARDTDINVIVQRYTQHGQVPATMKKAMSGDFTDLPTSLRDLLEMGRQLQSHRRNLPEELQGIPIKELLTLTPQQLKEKLKKPEPPAEQKDEPK